MKIILFVILLIAVGDGDTVNAVFTCQKQGKFANPDAIGCTTYFYCDSNLQSSIQNCPPNTYYWPLNKGCFSYYDCAMDTSPDGDDTNPCIGWEGTYTIDKYSTDCSSYIYCETSYLGNDGFTSNVVRLDCPSGYSYILDRGCRENYQCTNYQCTGEGYFANPSVNDCSGFIICKKYTNYNTGAITLYPTFEKCPANTRFSPFSKKCDEFYVCGGNNPHPVADPCLNYNWAVPTAKNPHSNNCKTYLGCSATAVVLNGVIDVIVKKSCPANTFFSPTIGKCYYNHVCNQNCSKDPCSNGVGKFVDYKSGDCEGFVECRDDSKIPGVYRPTYERRYCPPGTLFSLQTRDCVRNYNCPTFPINYCYAPIPTTPPPTGPPPVQP